MVKDWAERAASEMMLERVWMVRAVSNVALSLRMK